MAASGVDEKYYINSDGAETESRVPRVNFFGILTAISGGEVAQRLIQHGGDGRARGREEAGPGLQG